MSTPLNNWFDEGTAVPGYHTGFTGRIIPVLKHIYIQIKIKDLGQKSPILL